MTTAQYPTPSMVTAEHSVASVTGAEGGVITVHRTMATVPLKRTDVWIALGFTAAFGAIALLLAPAVFALWRWIFVRGAEALALEGTLRFVPTSLGASVPMFVVDAARPGPVALVVGAILVVALLVAGQLIGDRALPLTYFIRAVALVLGTAVFLYAIDDSPPTLDLAAYTRTLLKVSAGIWIFLPVGYGLTFFLLDIAWSRKAGLLALAMAHLALFIPLQVLLTQYLVKHLTLLAVPMFFVFGGVIPLIAVIIAFYAWGASWPARTP